MSQLRNLMISKQVATPGSYTILPQCYFLNSPVTTDIFVTSQWTKLEISATPDADTTPFIFGTRTSSSATDKLEIRANSSLNRFNIIIGSNVAAYAYVTDITTRSDISIDGTDIVTTNSGSTTTVSVGETPGFVDSQYPVCFGAIQNGATPNTSLRMYGYFYGCKIYINNTLTHDIVPAKDLDGVVCLADRKTDTLYYPLQYTFLYEEKPTVYTQLPYCYFSNSPVDLEFPLVNTISKIELSFMCTTYDWIFGARDNQTSAERFTIQAGTNNISTNNISASTSVSVSDFSKKIEYTYDVTNSTITIINNGNTYTGTNSRGIPNGNRNLLIGSVRNGANPPTSNFMIGYFWFCKIYDAGVLAHEIVPAKDPINRICLYDLTTHKACYTISGLLAEEAPS